jgi:Tfp pilus assembly protein PilF
LYRRAFEIDPDYLFARSGLAKHCAWRGDFEAAKEMLAPVLERGKYHYSEWRAILITQREMALKSGDRAAAQRIGSAILDLQARFE